MITLVHIKTSVDMLVIQRRCAESYVHGVLGSHGNQ